MGRRNHVIQASAFATLATLATVVSLEIGATAAFHWFDHWPSQDQLRMSLSEAAPDAPGEDAGKRGWSSVLHPYLGYVRNPDRVPRRVNRRLDDASINEFGFFGPSPLAPKGRNVARVVVTGGSVAEELFLYSGESLARSLEESGTFEDRRVELISLAMAGFKQPQQLMAVSYLLLLGADFDAVINLDGLNEVVLPFTDLVPLNVAPSYPFRWNGLALNTINAETSLRVARVAELEKELEAWRSFLSAFPLRHSAFALASWNAVQTRFENRRQRLEGELREQLGTSLVRRPTLRGPPAAFESDDALFVNSVELWMRASIQLWRLCQSHGVAYLHVLQPNQYVAGSKPFSPGERKIAILPTRNLTRVAAEAGYRMLISAGARLSAVGLPFVDMTHIFERVDEPIYRDGCCHYYDRGYQMIADRIALDLGPTSLEIGTESPRELEQMYAEWQIAR